MHVSLVNQLRDSSICLDLSCSSQLHNCQWLLYQLLLILIVNSRLKLWLANKENTSVLLVADDQHDGYQAKTNVVSRINHQILLDPGSKYQTVSLYHYLRIVLLVPAYTL